MKKKPELKSAAVLTLIDPSDYSAKGRKAIADWLRKQAKDLLKYGPQGAYAKTFRARYLYNA